MGIWLMTNTNYVYLAGPMEGVPNDIMRGWRDFSANFLANHGIQVKDPCRRKKFHDEEFNRNLARRIVKMDLQDISYSQVLLVNLTSEVMGKSRGWGSISEIAHAHTKNKIIIVITDKDYKHPFLEFYATEIFHNLEEALEAVVHYYL
jgi:nucleoside 2-deoxyribosyltransferase